MTYCVAIKVNKGLVFASDSRTNAGVDYISTYSKMFTFDLPEDRVMVLLSSGNLATTQSVINSIKRDIEHDSVINLKNMHYLYDAADYIGKLSQKYQREHHDSLQRSGISAEASFILGGQIHGHDQEIYLIYPQGNYISTSEDTPYLQIGETKYGKPILDRIIRAETTLEDAARCAIVSLDSTMRSNISVGPPIELSVCERNDFQISRYLTLKFGTPFYTAMQKSWNDGLRRAFNRLPRFDWELPALVKDSKSSGDN
jgi:putative proteasome-type protease